MGIFLRHFLTGILLRKGQFSFWNFPQNERNSLPNIINIHFQQVKKMSYTLNLVFFVKECKTKVFLRINC